MVKLEEKINAILHFTKRILHFTRTTISSSTHIEPFSQLSSIRTTHPSSLPPSQHVPLCPIFKTIPHSTPISILHYCPKTYYIPACILNLQSPLHLSGLIHTALKRSFDILSNSPTRDSFSTLQTLTGMEKWLA